MFQGMMNENFLEMIAEEVTIGEEGQALDMENTISD